MPTVFSLRSPRRMPAVLCGLAVLLLAACAAPPAAPVTRPVPGGDAAAPGHVMFRGPNGHIYRLIMRADTMPEDITRALDRLAPRANDAWLNTSADSRTLLFATERFDPQCGGWA